MVQRNRPGNHVRRSNGNVIQWTDEDCETPAHWETEEMAKNYCDWYRIEGEVFQCEGKLCKLPHSDFKWNPWDDMKGPALPRRSTSAEIAISRSYRG